jgi:hypothetical protein
VVTRASLTPATKSLVVLIVIKWVKSKTVKTFMTGFKLENAPKITARRPAGYYHIGTVQHGLVGAIEKIYALRVTTNMNIVDSRLEHQIHFARDSVAKAPGYPAGDFYSCESVQEKLEFVKHDVAFLHVQESGLRKGGVLAGCKSGFQQMSAVQLRETGELLVGDPVRSVGVVPAIHNGVPTGAVTIFRDDGRFVGHVQPEKPNAKKDAPINKKHGYCEDGESGGCWANTEEDDSGTYPALAYTNNSVSSLNYIYAPEYTLESFEDYVLSAI